MMSGTPAHRLMTALPLLAWACSPHRSGYRGVLVGSDQRRSGITTIERFPTHDLRVRRGGEVSSYKAH
jgi:hypothetical protein